MDIKVLLFEELYLQINKSIKILFQSYFPYVTELRVNSYFFLLYRCKKFNIV